MNTSQTISLWTIILFPTIKSAEENAATKSAEEDAAIKAVEEVCYPVIGCFSLESPWDGFWRPAPQSPESLRIQFYLITRNTHHKSIEDWRIGITETYRPAFGAMVDLDYQKTRDMTVIQIYGYYSSEDRKWNRIKAMAEAYLSKQDVNVIFVDWDSNGHSRGYRECVSNTRVVAAVAAKLIEGLTAFNDLTPSKIHIIGFSLGAHIAGYIGKIIPGIHRITALDAAQPGFEGFDKEVRLHHDDAKFVDAIHTNARPFFTTLGLGYIDRIGHVDFYFNGGAHQPGCWRPDDERFQQYNSVYHPKRILTLLVYGLMRCSHHRSVEYWIEALSSTDCIMWGVKHQHSRPYPWRRLSSRMASGMRLSWRRGRRDNLSKDISPVGLNTFQRNIRGVFHVRTYSSAPYCLQYFSHVHIF